MKIMELELSDNLTTKQKLFVLHYVASKEGADAARKAGYSPHTCRQMAYENMTKPYIKKEVEKVMSKIAEECGITAKSVLKNIQKITEQCAQTYQEKGLDIPINPSIALKGNELLGKHLNLFENKLDVKINNHEDLLNQVNIDN